MTTPATTPVTYEKEKYLNRLFVCDDNVGTIRYVGPVRGVPNGETETWFGVEWKDPLRGKHDGLFKSERYFQTKHPKGGSFVRPSKCEFGVDIWRAAQDKYLPTPTDEEIAQQKEKEKLPLDLNEDEFIFNNFATIKSVASVRAVSLAYCKIDRLLGEFATFTSTFKQLRELDLEGNLLSDWTELLDALNSTPTIQLVNVSNTSLSPITAGDEKRVNSSVVKLIVNRMNYSWQDLLDLSAYFPNLLELKACHNKIDKIERVSEEFRTRLRLLDVESNPIGDWKQVNKLGELEALEELYVNKVGIADIFFDDCGPNEKTRLFPRLRTLGLNENNIGSGKNEWRSINELNKLRSLSELRFRDNPLNRKESTATMRELFIVKIASLKMLNRTMEDRTERVQAEYDYLKRFGQEWWNATQSKAEQNVKDNLLAEFNKNHPRYTELIEKHGAAEVSEFKQESETAIKNSLINLHLKNALTDEVITKRLPLSLTVQRLRMLLCRLFKASFEVNDSRVRLYYTSKADPSGTEFLLDSDSRSLGFFAVADEDTILIKDS